MSKKHCVI